MRETEKNGKWCSRVHRAHDFFLMCGDTFNTHTHMATTKLTLAQLSKRYRDVTAVESGFGKFEIHLDGRRLVLEDEFIGKHDFDTKFNTFQIQFIPAHGDLKSLARHFHRVLCRELNKVKIGDDIKFDWSPSVQLTQGLGKTDAGKDRKVHLLDTGVVRRAVYAPKDETASWGKVSFAYGKEFLRADYDFREIKLAYDDKKLPDVFNAKLSVSFALHIAVLGQNDETIDGVPERVVSKVGLSPKAEIVSYEVKSVADSSDWPYKY